MRTQYINTLPETWEPTATVFAALGDSTRQKILLLFEKDEELSIKSIADVFSLSRTSITYHLNVLEKAGIISARRQGKEALYSIKTGIVLDAIDRLREYIVSEL